MRWVRLSLLVLALLLVGAARLLPLRLDGVEDGASSAVRSQIARDLGGGAAEVARWIAERPAEYAARIDAESERRRDFLTYDAPAGWRLPYLGGFDSYVWVRSARNVLRHGTPCDSVVAGVCRDDFTLAPVGTQSRYASSFHVQALVGLHRLLSLFAPGVPLELSAFLLSFLVGLLGVFPAFWLGCRFGGAIGGFASAILVSFNTTVLYRSFGADNDIWNVVLPLFEVWAAIEAIYARDRGRRIVFILIAAAVTGLHAATWNGWILTSAIIVLGLTANAVLWTVRRMLHGERVAGLWQGAVEALSLAGGYLLASTAATWIAGAQSSPLASVAEIVAAVFATADAGADGVALRWPSVFETVGELRRPNLAGVAQWMAGPVYFFVAWLGLILLMLPRSGWQSWHFAVLIGGNLLYRYLLTYQSIDPWTLALLLILPLAVAAGAYLADGDSPVEDQGAAATIILWFFAGLLLSFRGTRFLIILAPPLAVLCAVAVGRLYQWIERQPWASPPLRVMTAIALLATMYPPIARGERTARTYLPMMNDAWHDALTTLRDRTPPSAIVNTWWDYGYFVKYVAERRVLSDGGTLSTHVHYWISRAMIAGSEAESVGLLRMLNCGSDAYPEPEGRHGAFGALLDAGVAAGRAVAAIVEVASMQRPEALDHLLSMGLSRPQAELVLERTHCDPPPGFVVLPADFARSIGWRSFGGWSFLDQAAAAVRNKPEAPAQLGDLFGIDRESAAAAVQRVGAGGAGGTGAPRYLTVNWSACSGAEVLRCEIGLALPSGEILVAVVVPVLDASATRLVVRDRAGSEREVAPRSVLLPDPEVMREIALAADESESVLVDVDGRRVLVGSAEVLGSTVTRLLFLNADQSRHFEPFDRHPGLAGDVTTWRILW